ncbi:uncharacterized protein DEA37_0001399, partial [Paragonimus westermani]
PGLLLFSTDYSTLFVHKFGVEMITYQRSYLRYNRHINAEPFRNLFSGSFLNKRYLKFDCSSHKEVLQECNNFTNNDTSFSSLTHIASGERSPVYEIHLDQRKLRTPGGKALLVPNEVLALALAREWDSQKNTIQRHCMHLVCSSFR